MKDEMKILIGLHRIVNSLDKKTSNIASKYKLTFSQFMVLEALYSKGNMTIGEVRDHILSSVGTIPLIINNLEKNKYIERLSDENDKRVCILQLTKEGREIIAEIAPQNDEAILDYMSVLNKAQKKDLLFLLSKLGGKYYGKNNKNQSERF